MDTTAAPFREVGFCKPSVDIERRSDDTLILRSGEPLPPVKACTTDWLAHWAAVRPNSPMLVQRGKQGKWVSWSVGEVWDAVRAIATGLLRHGVGTTAPVAILSENSIAQALLTWGALYAGVPVAPVSPAYSLMGGSYHRLCSAVSLVNPHLVFVEDAARFAGASRHSGCLPIV
ncbi:hypothetical protein AWV79_13735 [Cupriavidus sp. UYMMa02A]|nr:hypothetical protein AWV79_13735 [Cupriavidus sp. UYMMa02A]